MTERRENVPRSLSSPSTSISAPSRTKEKMVMIKATMLEMRAIQEKIPRALVRLRSKKEVIISSMAVIVFKGNYSNKYHY